jgi:hypothetical protein
MMRQFVSLLAGGCVLTQIVSAWAAPLDYDSLPKGSVGAMPKLADAPKSVPWGKASPGFLLVKQPEPKRKFAKGGDGFFQLSANKVDSARMQKGAPQAPEDTFELTSCFQTLPVSSLESAPGWEWPGGGEPVTSMLLQKQDAPNQTGLYAAHVERWVESADGVALETSDAWIDLATQGVRVYRRSHLPLVRVAEPYAGVTVYAGRTERSVEFVVRMRPGDNKRGGQFASHFGPGLVITKDNQSTSSSCGFVRIGFDGEPGEGQTANAVTDVAIAFDLDAGKSVDDPTPGLEPTDPIPREATLRALSLNLSVSRLASDLRPVAAVSYGFVGDERRFSF